MDDFPNKLFASMTYAGTLATAFLQFLSVVNEVIVAIVGLATLASSVVWIWYIIQKNRREQRIAEETIRKGSAD